MVNIKLPDGGSLELELGATVKDLAGRISRSLGKDAVGAIVNGELFDLLRPLPDGAEVNVLTKRDPEFQTLFRHTLSHVLAQAVRGYFADRGYDPALVRLGVGPVIENGFYYDIDPPQPITDADLPAIEERMRAIIRKNLPLERRVVTRAEALAVYRGGDPYKTELIEDLPEDAEISFYTQRDGAHSFTDLCRGPHLQSTGRIPPHFKLTHVAGAYWRGDEHRPMLQRVYGVAFRTKEELDHYLWQQREAKERDHRKLGRELDLFTISDEVGKGLPLWLPKGAFIRQQLERYMLDKEREHGYQHVITPHIANAKLYYTSGHLPYYKDDMYAPIEIEGEEYYLKPMNCPHHHMIFKARPKSYRELPLRLAEFGTVYRFELSGTLSGLSRVRGFTQNDAHIYCTKAQVKDEFIKVIELLNEVYQDFGIEDYWFRFSLPDFEHDPEKFGQPGPHWDESIAAIREALDETSVPFVEGAGEATFYGPKLDVQFRTVLGREESIATNQLDFITPGKFGLEFTNERGQKEIPVVIHRAIMGSFDRFFAFYLEHTAGEFPLWLAPLQALLIPITDRHQPYAKSVAEALSRAGLRVEIDVRAERMNAKIRDAELKKIPLILIIGDQEVDSGTINLRDRRRRTRESLSLEALIEKMKQRERDKI